MTLGMMADLAGAVDRLSRWEGAALMLTAAGTGAFCAGGHLADVRGALADPERGRTMARAMTAVLDGLLELPVVSVAVVHGRALGGGAELVTACDLRVIAKDADIHFVQARLGIAPGWGGTARLVRLVGRSTALRALATSASIGAEEALRIGLVDAIADGSGMEEARALLAPFVALSPGAVRAVKRQVVAATPRVGPADAEADAFVEVWGGAEHQRALAAHDRKRAG
jgi:ethylmalonyl-CoA/methylmalonyl-CoA decarboxylase